MGHGGAVRSAVVAVLLALVAGCGGDPVRQPGATLWSPAASPDPAEARWSEQVAVDRETGALSAPGFNALIDSAAPGWARSTDGAAAELLGLRRPFDGPVEIYLHQDTEPSEPVVTVTLTKLGDDSVQAIRYRVVFKRGADGRYRFVSGARTTRCQSGRGHRDFDVGTCA